MVERINENTFQILLQAVLLLQDSVELLSPELFGQWTARLVSDS